MAEVLGVVASGVGIGSLAIQLFDSLQKLHRFWKLVDGAPKDIESLVEELHVLGCVFDELIKGSEVTENLPVGSLEVCLKYCSKVMNDLNPIVQRLHSGIAKGNQRKQWTSIKAAFKKEDLRDLVQRLERSKSTLGLAIDIYMLFVIFLPRDVAFRVS